MFETSFVYPENRPEQGIPRKDKECIDIEDVEDAREYMQDLIEAGTYPLLTVPEEYIASMGEYGISFIPKQDYRTGKKFSFVAGTIGIDPYFAEGGERYVLEVDPERVNIEPRFTGQDRHFHGVVGFVGGITPDAIRILGKFSADSWSEYQRENNREKEKGLETLH